MSDSRGAPPAGLSPNCYPSHEYSNRSKYREPRVVSESDTSGLYRFDRVKNTLVQRPVDSGFRIPLSSDEIVVFELGKVVPKHTLRLRV